MKKIALLNPTRIVISAFAGTLALTFPATDAWNHPPGDDPSRIKEANALLEQLEVAANQCYSNTNSNSSPVVQSGTTSFDVFDVVSGGFIQYDDESVWPLPQEESGPWEHYATGTTYKIVDIPSDGATILVTANHKPRQSEILPVVNLVAKWKNIKKESVSFRLTPDNARILEAKAMTHLRVNPDKNRSYEWDGRFRDAQRSFGVCTKTQRICGSVGAAALPFLVVMLASWLALLILAWLWYFFLDRLSEVSRAVRGKGGDDKT